MKKNITINRNRLIIISLLFFTLIPTVKITAKTVKLLSPDAWEQKAQEGDAYYQAILGASLKNGYFHKKDCKQAILWLEKALKKENPIAYFNLAQSYDQGQGVPENKKKAKELYAQALPGLEKLAKKRDTYAQLFLAELYQAKTAGINNDTEAMKLLKRSAAKGNPVAQAKLAEFYYENRFKNNNEKLAFIWYEKSAKQNMRLALRWIGQLYEDGHGTKQDINEAIKWYTLGKSMQEGDCINNLGTLYEIGRGVPSDIKKAMELYQKAMDLGNERGIMNLALLYEKGDIIPKNEAKAEKLFKKAAMMGNEYAQKKSLEFAEKYLQQGDKYNQKAIKARNAGNYILARDHCSKAIQCLRSSAELGNVKAQNRLGLLLLQGQDNDHNYTQALNWFKSAASAPDLSPLEKEMLPMKNLGYMYYKGLGTPADYETALTWLNLAKKNGDKTSQDYINMIQEEINAVKTKQKTPDLNLFQGDFPFENFAYFKFTPDEKYVISSVFFKLGSNQKEKTAREQQQAHGVVFIWDAKTGKLINRIGENIQSFSLSMSPNGNFIAGLSKDYTWIEIIEIPSGKVKYRLKIPDGKVDLGGINLAKDNQNLFVSTFNPKTKDSKIRLFNILTGSPIKTIYSDSQNKNCSYINLKLSHDNKYLSFIMHDYSLASNAIGTKLETRMLIDCENSSNFYKFKENPENVSDICFNPINNFALLFDSKTQGIQMWDIKNKNVIFKNKGIYENAAFHPQGKYFITSDINGDYNIWLKEGKAVKKIGKESTGFNEITFLNFTPAGNTIYIGGKTAGKLSVKSREFNTNATEKQ